MVAFGRVLLEAYRYTQNLALMARQSYETWAKALYYRLRRFVFDSELSDMLTC